MNIPYKIVNRLKWEFTQTHNKCNDKIKKSNWYHNLFPHLVEYERLTKNADYLAIGSSPAKYAIDFRNIDGIKGYNLAILPETIYYDFQVLKNYHSFLKPGGTILFVLCPFTFLKDKYLSTDGGTTWMNLRYYPILHRALIDNFDYSIFHKWIEEPMLIGKDAWKRLLKDSPLSTNYNLSSNSLSDDEMLDAAEKRIKGWMREFNLTDLDPEHLPQEIINAINRNLSIYKDMKAFVKERGYKAVIVIPPFSAELTTLLPTDFINYTLYSQIREIGLPYISYIGEYEWMKKEYYRDAFLMNATGRNKLTKDIISKLNDRI